MDAVLFVNADKINTVNKFQTIIEQSCTVIGKRLVYFSTNTVINSGVFETSGGQVSYNGLKPLCVVLGGDGTILSTANFLHEHRLPIGPIMGVNFGKLGYLAHFSSDDFEKQMASVVSNGYPCSERVILNCQIDGVDHVAFNDFVIDIGPPFRMVELDIFIDGTHFSKIRGDGVIISTPTGSTAYNLSVGGPIVESNVDGIVISPNAPHKISIRPFVINANRIINIIMKKTEGAYAILDGQRQLLLNGEQNICIRKSIELLKIIEPKNGFLSALTQKLNWGR